MLELSRQPAAALRAARATVASWHRIVSKGSWIPVPVAGG